MPLAVAAMAGHHSVDCGRVRPVVMTAAVQPCPSRGRHSALHGNPCAAHKVLDVKNCTLGVAAQASGVLIVLSLSLVFASICGLHFDHTLYA